MLKEPHAEKANNYDSLSDPKIDRMTKQFEKANEAESRPQIITFEKQLMMSKANSPLS